MSRPVIMEFSGLSLKAMEALARLLAARLAVGDLLALSGDLGSGKTSFARALILSISGGHAEVTSPTFTLMQSYDVLVKGVPAILWHLDLYRLEREEEAEALGLEDIWSDIVLIEWPERAEEKLPEDRLDVRFAMESSPDTRRLILSGNDAWRRRLEALI